MVFCSKCGREGNQKFCEGCGTPLTKEEPNQKNIGF